MNKVSDEYRRNNDMNAGAFNIRSGEKKHANGTRKRRREFGLKLLDNDANPDFHHYEAVRCLDHTAFTGFENAFNLRTFMRREFVDQYSPVFSLMAYFARKNKSMELLLASANSIKGKSKNYRKDNIGMLNLRQVHEFEELAKQYADFFIRFLYLRIADGDKIRDFPDFSAEYWRLFKLSHDEYKTFRQSGAYAASLCNIMDQLVDFAKDREKIAEPA